MSERAARFAAVMAMLLAAHDLGDHVVQTDHQAATKAGDWRGMAGHIAGYHVTQLGGLLALRRWCGVRPTWRRTAAAVAFSAVSHAFLDRRWPVVQLLQRTGSERFAAAFMPRAHPFTVGFGDDVEWVDVPLPLHGPYLADQALHHAALTLSALILAGGQHREPRRGSSSATADD